MNRNALPDPGYWRGRRVLLTGHTGFKGAWAALWLEALGAEVHGFALAPSETPNLWSEIGDGLLAGETIGDIRDEQAVRSAVISARPEVVLHMAAQALVRRGYSDPIGTIATNALGTAHLLDALRGAEGLHTVLIVTTDKVYAAEGPAQPWRETDRLGGGDPYSASKAAAELLTQSFARSYLEPAGARVATARAGNVIGGGDWSEDRLVPDVWRAARGGSTLRLRYPDATRPWQHVLEPLAGYFAYVEALATGEDMPRALNFGPPPADGLSVRDLAEAVSQALGAAGSWSEDPGPHPTEAAALSLDPSLARTSIGWSTRLSPRQAADWTARWYSAFDAGASARDLCLTQIREYQSRNPPAQLAGAVQRRPLPN